MSFKKISVIGAGNVGAEVANQLVSRELGNVTLLDKEGDLARGKALDIRTSASLKNSSSSIIGTDDYELTANSDIVIITAGLPRKHGMTREQLIEANAKITTGIVENIKKHTPDSIIIMVTNPLDVMTYLAYKVSGFKSNKVIGMAGVLDSARFKIYVAEELNVSPCDVNAMVLGTHGDEMVPVLESASVAGIPLQQLISSEKLEQIVQRTKNGGAEVVSLLKTGSAYYAPAASAVLMAEAIIKDRKTIVPASVLLSGEYGINDVYLGVPVQIGSHGAEKIMEFDLNPNDLEKLKISAGVVKENIDKLLEILSITK